MSSEQLGRVRLCVWHGSLVDADNVQDWSAGAELNMRANSDVDRRTNSLSINKGAEPRIRVEDQATAFAESKLSMLARHHWPLVLRKEIVAHGRIASHQHQFAGERTFSLQLTAAVLCQDYLHKISRWTTTIFQLSFDIFHFSFDYSRDQRRETRSPGKSKRITDRLFNDYFSESWITRTPGF